MFDISVENRFCIVFFCSFLQLLSVGLKYSLYDWISKESRGSWSLRFLEELLILTIGMCMRLGGVDYQQLLGLSALFNGIKLFPKSDLVYRLGMVC